MEVDLNSKNLKTYIVDMGNVESIKKFREDYKKDYSDVDIIINNAGIIQPFVKVGDLDDTTLPIKPISPEKINVGDVMLYGNNCLVIFYKSFDTSYSYTKIGHIDNLPDLGSDSITVKFEK